MIDNIVINSVRNDILHNYSTTEQQIGTWIDGRPIYSKTISYTTSSTEGNNYYEYASDVDFAIIYWNILFDSGNTARCGSYIVDGTGGYIRCVTEDSGKFVVTTSGSRYVSRPGYATLLYVKKTKTNE